MRFNDGAADRQPHTGAVRFGGKERMEDLFLLRGQTPAGIGNRDQQLTILGLLRLDRKFAPGVHVLHGINAIEHEVHQQLQQVLMNLMLNGIDAMKDMDAGGELTIKPQQAENGQLLISVTDTGGGLPPQQEEIFHAFFTTKPHGTGMGLSISRSIVESHGGRLWAADSSPRGASFYFTLPSKAEAHT